MCPCAIHSTLDPFKQPPIQLAPLLGVSIADISLHLSATKTSIEAFIPAINLQHFYLNGQQYSALVLAKKNRLFCAIKYAKFVSIGALRNLCSPCPLLLLLSPAHSDYRMKMMYWHIEQML